MAMYYVDQWDNRVIVSVLKIGDGLILAEDTDNPGVIVLALDET